LCNHNLTLQAPFSVELHVEALLVMDLHSHAFHSEVIGLLGGRYYEEGAVLRITRSQPCKSNSSGVHCDMCPVSQTEASERLHAEDLEVVGWYHSHPKFFPNPSVQDLDTQSNMQSWLCKSSVAFVSFILSPYCPTSRTLASEYRCMIVEKNEDAGPLGTPYRLKVDVVSYGLSVTTFMNQIAQIFTLSENSNMGVVDFSSLYSSNLSYTDKCVESAKHHLSQCDPLVGETLLKNVLRAVSSACKTLSVLKQSVTVGVEI
ncbi:unnamed protein product, partial [Timema podura]|nr:unnamed protein product [Timema podura]